MFVVAALAALVCAATALATPLPGKLIKSGHTSGQFAVTAVNADVTKPKVLYGRATGHVSSATFVVGCSRGFSVASNSLSRSSAGVWRLPMMPHPDSCSIVASVGGSGNVSVEIRAVK